MMKKNKILLPIAITMAVILITSTMGVSEAQTGPSATKTHVFKSGTGNLYTVVFKVCAGDSQIRVPEVIVSSASAVQSVKLSKTIDKNTCQLTATELHAIDPNTIKLKLLTVGQISKMVNTAEKKVGDLKSKIDIKNQELVDTVSKESPSASSAQTKAKTNSLASELVELRKQLNDARAEYYRLLYLLNS